MRPSSSGCQALALVQPVRQVSPLCAYGAPDPANGGGAQAPLLGLGLERGFRLRNGCSTKRAATADATEMLKQSLVITRAEGIDAALVTCDVDNIASSSVISKCGGEFLDLASSSVDGKPIKRFWVR